MKQLENGLVVVGKDILSKKKHSFWYGEWEIFHWDKTGRLIWNEIILNGLCDEGEYSMLDIYLRGNTPPTSFYLGLCNSTPTDTTTLATLTDEPPGTYGYARQQVERSNVGWPVLALDAGDYRATSKLVTFNASGGVIGPVITMFLCDVVSGTAGILIATAALSQSRTIEDSESLGCKMRIKAK